MHLMGTILLLTQNKLQCVLTIIKEHTTQSNTTVLLLVSRIGLLLVFGPFMREHSTLSGFPLSTHQSCFVAVMRLTTWNQLLQPLQQPTRSPAHSPQSLLIQLLATSLSILIPFYLADRPSTSRLGETHMGELPAGMPARAPNHGALTLPPSVSASPVCCRFANRTIQMVSRLLPPWPPTLATSEGQRDSLGDLWFSTVHRTAPPSWILG